MAVRGRSLSVLVHSDTKVGKSTFANTAPAPRLLIDSEAAHRFLPGRKVYWDPMQGGPPEYDGTWDTCVVVIREYTTMVQVLAWLTAGQHPFESIVVDSISEVQKRLYTQVSEGGGMDQRKWGEMLVHMEGLVRQLRDLTEHPTKPVTAVVITAMTEQRDGKYRPYVQGQLRTTMPYFIDVVGYMFVTQIPNADPSQPATEIRRMLTRPHPQFEAGERVQGRIPAYVDSDEINVARMIDAVFGPLPELTTTGTGASE